MKRRLSAVLFCLVLPLFLLTSCHRFASLDEITDEMLRSNVQSYSVTFWSGSYQNGISYHLSWKDMNGYRHICSLNPSAPTEAVLNFTAADAGEGYRVVLLTPDGALTDLVEGDNTLTLPEGRSQLILAAVDTSGDFTLELSSDSGLTMHASDD